MAIGILGGVLWSTFVAYYFVVVLKYAKPILFLTIFIDLLGFGIIIPILPVYVKALTGSDFLVGLSVAVFAISSFFFTPIWGSLSDKYGRRPIILGSVLVSLLSYVFLSFASVYFIVIIARILGGIGSGNISAAQAYISDITEPKDRAKSMGMVGAAFGLGFIFGPPIGGFLMEGFGFASIGIFCASLCLLNFLLAFFLLPESIKEKRDSKINVLPIKDYMHVLSMKLLPLLIFIGFVYVGAFFLFQIPSTLMWKEHYGFSDKEIGFVFMFIGVCTAVVQGGLIGVFTKWIGERNLLFWGNVFLGVSLVGMPFVPKAYFIPLELLLLFFLAVANGFVGPSALSMVSQIAPSGEQGKVMGIYQSVGSLARAAGPVAGASLYGVDYRLPYIVAMLIYLANAAMVIYFLRKLSISQREENVVAVVVEEHSEKV